MTEWVELSYGFDVDEVRGEAERRLAEVGLLPAELSDEELRMDVGVLADRRGYFRVSVRKAVLDNAGRRGPSGAGP